MARNLYITPTEARSGKSAIVLGLMEILLRNIDRVGFFRPIINTIDPGREDRDIRLIRSHYRLDLSYENTYAFTFQEARELINRGRQDTLIEGVVAKYKALEERCDFVLCEGTDFEGVTTAFEFDINVDIAQNLGSPLLIVTNGRGRNADDIIGSTELAIDSFAAKGAPVLAVVVNRTTPALVEEVTRRLREALRDDDCLGFVIPEEPMLGKPTPREIAKVLGAEILAGREHLDQLINHYTVAAMHLRNFLKYIQEGSLVVVPGDRGDIIVGSLASTLSSAYSDIAGILLTGGLRPDDTIARLIESWSEMRAPVLLVQEDTFNVTQRLTTLYTDIDPDDARKVASVLRVFEAHVDTDALRKRLIASRPASLTPKMFEYGLIQKAKAHRQRIVLPEGTEDRILRAAEIITRRGVAGLVLLGDVESIRERIHILGLIMDDIDIIDPAGSPGFEDYARTYYELRRHKGLTLEAARDMMADATYFGTMMVYKGDADGMVSGAVSTTQHTVRPAFEFIRTKPGCSIVSSVFLMCLKDRVLVYGDCAVNPNPNAGQLAEIALSAAETARTFDIEPRVAMLSYSSGSSGKGSEVEKVREATRLARERAPQLRIEGPIQYDAAIDPEVARTKLPGSEVAGQATVFIFPDLNTGNNTYKAVQRSAKAVAIGPVLQGLRKPVNDLSRGCTIADIVNTVAITAIQAQAEKELA